MRYFLHTIIFCCFFSAVISDARADDDFPLRNGKFYDQHTGAQVAHWKYDDAGGSQKISGRVEMRIDTVAGAPASLSQDLLLPPGNYKLSIELAVAADSQAQLSAGSAKLSVPPTPGFQPIELPFDASEDVTTVRIASVQPGALAIRNARIDVIRLATAAVPLNDGTVIGGILLPDNATPAERFAAWELQSFVHRMTGVTPGIQGRDPTFEGRTVQIGRATAVDLKDKTGDSYAIEVDEKTIRLAGNNDRGTLYAVYDYLKTQGCGWYLPGAAGEVVPHRQALDLPSTNRLESPDWVVRRPLIYRDRFDSSNKHSLQDERELVQWAVRNRFNSLWGGGHLTTYFPEYLGGSHEQIIGHTWDMFKDDAHPEWHALVNGVRTPKHSSGAPNMPCTSNPEFRAHVIDTILKYFKDKPEALVYALNPEDEPANWCECETCRAADGDEGKGPWVTKPNGVPPMSMSDRVIDFVNAVADAVGAVYPDKRIELYGYGSYRNGPKRHPVSPNVMIVYCYWPGIQLGSSAEDRSLIGVQRAVTEIESWRKAGAKHFGLYDYGNYTHRDAPYLAFNHIVTSLKMLHDEYNFDFYSGETDNNVTTSFMAYTIRAEALWNKNTDWRDTVAKVCQRMYGPAGQTMADYYFTMHKTLEDWKPQWKTVSPDDPANKNTDPALPEWAGGTVKRTLVGSTLGFYWANDLIEFNTAAMFRGQAILKKAKEQVGNDAMLIRRVEIVEFAHDFMTHLVAGKTADPQSQNIAQTALKRAVELWGKYPETRVLIESAAQFGYVEPPQPISNAIYTLPLKWQFRTDPENVGTQQGWPATGPNQEWGDIRTDRDWTAQGHPYHGVAWYGITFTLPAEARERFDGSTPIQLHFDAIDGYAEMYLNGKQIGSQSRSPAVAWDQPCTIDLPADFDPSIPHTLVVRVTKDSAAAGIWKPVAFVTATETAATAQP